MDFLACLLSGGVTGMTRPVLGIICCTRTVGPEPAQAVMNRYAIPAMSYGDVAALLVPNLDQLMTAAEVAPRLDGLLLTGSPSNMRLDRYGAEGEPDPQGPWDPGRDGMGLALIDAMLEAGKPVFGICRGIQEINVAFGGTLRRDTACNPDLLVHHAPPEVGFWEMFDHQHPVSLTQGGVLNRAMGADEMAVSSVHFQGLERLGVGLNPEAHAPDGLVEAVSATVNGAPVLAVQWHPEWRVDENPQCQTYFKLLGAALRGDDEAIRRST